MEYVSKRIAEIAKERKMYIEIHLGSNCLKEPTYQQLIEWIFEYANTIECDLKDNIKWLEFWYQILIPEIQDNEFVLEGFIEMLLNWFENNNLYLIVFMTPNQYWQYNIDVYKDKKLIEEHQWDMLETKQEARHEGILKIFELIKENK